MSKQIGVVSKEDEATIREQIAIETTLGKVPPGASAKKHSQQDKAAGKGVGRDWSGQGKKDAAVMLQVDQAADQERVKILMGLGIFASFGYGESHGKKQTFHEQTESYFSGWREFRDSLPQAQRASFGVRYAEARRVCNAYIVKGKEFMDDLLEGPGTYHQKIMSLPTMTSGGQGKGTRGKTVKEEAGVNKLAKAEADQRVKIIAEFRSSEIVEIVQNLPESELGALCHALTARLAASKDKLYREIGLTVASMLKAAKVEELEQEETKEGHEKAA
jgi:hypothetical protein